MYIDRRSRDEVSDLSRHTIMCRVYIVQVINVLSWQEATWCKLKILWSCTWKSKHTFNE